MTKQGSMLKRVVTRLERLIEVSDQLVEANLADEKYWEAARATEFRAGLRHAIDVLMEESRRQFTDVS